MAEYRSDAKMAAAAVRFTKAVGKRVADPPDLRFLQQIQEQAEWELRTAVERFREQGFTDREIGAALGVTKQAVQKRWHREGHPERQR